MKNSQGFAYPALLTSVVFVLIIAAVSYVLMHPDVLGSISPRQQVTDSAVPVTPVPGSKTDTVGATDTIVWNFETAPEVDSMPQTKVSVTVNDRTHVVGNFTGSCSEITETGGIDGKGLLAGELSAAQCWFAGGGDEIGVFAVEDGGMEIMVGALSEGDAETPFFRGDFKIKTEIQL